MRGREGVETLLGAVQVTDQARTLVGPFLQAVRDRAVAFGTLVVRLAPRFAIDPATPPLFRGRIGARFVSLGTQSLQTTGIPPG
jgi:hypothetical protein